MDSAVEEKAAQRRAALKSRAAVTDRPRKEAAIHAAIAELVATRFAGQPVSAYLAMRDEIDPLPGLAAHRGVIGLPVALHGGQPLTFRRWSPGEELDAGLMGTRHPPATAPEVIPRLVLCPLAAFDRSGQRIGYGGGFYDRTLALLRARGPVTAVGIAFRAQQVPAIRAQPYDQPLDGIICEDGLHAFAPQG